MALERLSITFANATFLPVLLNWLLSLRMQNLPSPTTISLDEQTHQFLSERGFQSFLRPYSGSRNKLWVLRAQIFSEIINSGSSFIHSDTDAVWLGNPWPYITSLRADITCSQGTIWPPDITAKRGFVACCGFFHAKSNQRTKPFFERLAAHTANTSDDQISMNHLLDDFEVTWDVSAERGQTHSLQGVPFRCFDSAIFGISKQNGLKVALLPQHKFQRLHIAERDATVKHLLKSDSKQETKVHLENANCWFLRDDWEKISFTEQTLEKLMRDSGSINFAQTLPGESGGAWTVETHKALYPDIFNYGLANYIIHNFKPNAVLEFGSGLGELARYIAENSQSSLIHCIEPLIMPDEIKKNPIITQFTSDIFAEDEPDRLQPEYDLVLSIEVAEHIERANHDLLFDFLVKRCKKWLIFSAARVGQGGHGHIAERPEEEWRSELVCRRMYFREDITAAVRNACDKKNINHRRNIMVFEKIERS